MLAGLISAGAIRWTCDSEATRTSGPSRRTAGAGPIDVRLRPVTTLPAERFLDLTGTLFGQEEVTVAAKVPGRIVEIYAGVGDAVLHGGKLAQVETTDYVLASGEARSACLANVPKATGSGTHGDVERCRPG